MKRREKERYINRYIQISMFPCHDTSLAIIIDPMNVHTRH